MLLALILSTFVVFCRGQTVAPPPPSSVTFGEFTYGGNGCPQGSVSQNFNADRSAFTLLFDNYIASIGPGVSILENRKSCTLNMVVNVPSGYQYSLTTIDYRGYAKLYTGVTATQSSSYYFQGKTLTTRDSTVFKGPLKTNYAIRDSFPTTTSNYSPCNANANLNINMAIALASTSLTATGLMTKAAIDGQVKVYQRYELVWKKC